MNKTRFYFNPKNILKLIFGICTIVIISIFSACEQDPSSLGSDLLPDKIGYRYDSTFTFTGKVIKNDTIITSNLSTYSLGIINDPYFGSFSGSYVGQFVPQQYYDKDSTLTTFSVDSMFLFLGVDSIYGSDNEGLIFNVYELNKVVEEEYFSNEDIASFYNTSDIISSSTLYSGDTLIKIGITPEFIDKLIPDNQEDTTYKSITNFLSIFNGIAIVPELTGSTGEILNVNLSSINTKFTMYYNDSLTFDYKIGNNGLFRFANYTNDYSGSVVENYLINDESESDEYIFLQGITGLGSSITLSNIDNWFDEDSTFSVINAELFIPVFKDDNFDTFYPPKNLFMTYEYEDSLYSSIIDYYNATNGRGIFDGSYKEEKDYYRFYISKHLMKVLNRDVESNVLQLRMASGSQYPHRVILQTDGIKLKVTYTKH